MTRTRRRLAAGAIVALAVAVPARANCPWDCGDDDGIVGIVDFLALLGQWGDEGPCDFDGGGAAITDFLELLANWGPCNECVGDPGFIERSEATQAVIDQVILPHPLVDQLVAFSLPVPLAPGSVVEPFLPDGPAMIADDCSWLFYLDYAEESKETRDGIHCLVSGPPGSPVVEVTEQDWWPVVNGKSVYLEPEDYTVSPDRFWGEYPPDDPSCAIPPAAPLAPVPPPVPIDDDGQKLWSISFGGPGMWRKDLDKADNAFVKRGNVPNDNGKLAKLNKPTLAAKITEANDNKASCVYIYISAHTRKNTKHLVPTSGEDISPQQLANALANLDACSVYVVIDACKTGQNYIQPILDALLARDVATLNPHFPPTVGVFTSSNRERDANMIKGSSECNMSYWTRDWVGCWADPEADGPDEGEDVDIFEAFDWVLTNGCEKALRGNPDAGGFSYAECGGQIASIYRPGKGWISVEDTGP